MEKLKVGDNVVVINTMYPQNVPIGTKAVLSWISGDYVRIKKHGEDYGWSMRNGDLELLTEEPLTESQNKQILAYLRTGATINPMSALDLFGSFRLSARINDLRNDGHNIKTTMVYNGRKKWANYNLIQ